MERIFRYKVPVLFIWFAVLVAGCNCQSGRHELFSSIYYSSIKKGLPLCILLVDSSCCNEDIIKGDYSNLLDKCIFKVVDANLKENEWYLKWLGSRELPMLCCFSPKGALLDVISGIPDSHFVEQLIGGDLPLNQEREKSVFKNNPEGLKLLEQTIKNQLFIEAGVIAADQMYHSYHFEMYRAYQNEMYHLYHFQMYRLSRLTRAS